MNRIYIVCFVVCFILLAYLISVNSANLSKISGLEGKIKKLEALQFDKPIQTKIKDQIRKEERRQINHSGPEKEDQAEPITTSNKEQIKQMIEEAVQRHFEKEAENRKVYGIYTRVSMQANMLKLTDEQKDEFWPIMIDFHEQCQKLQEGFKGLDKTSRDSYRWQLQQLKERAMQSLKQILSSQQIEGLQVHLPE